MRPHIKHLIVVWRPGRSKSRIPVAIVKSNVFGTTFKYLQEGVEKAQNDGFVCFPDFPSIQDIHETNVLKILSQRINNSERSDIQGYYDFWEVPDKAKGDAYRLMSYTQGILPTDNFEFLAEYYGTRGIRFVSELTGLTSNPLENDALKEGDELVWIREPYNEYDPYAVALFREGQRLGYVKSIHSKVFYLPNSSSLKVRIKRIEHNGHISRAFILIYNSSEI